MKQSNFDKLFYDYPLIVIEGLVPDGDKTQVNTWLVYNELVKRQHETENRLTNK